MRQVEKFGGKKGGEDFGFTTWEDLKGFVAPIEWDWRGWLPRGFLTVVASEPGMGKSLLCLRVAGCFSMGWNWPDGQGFVGERGKVVWCEGEASQSLNLARAEAWGLRLGDLLSPMGHPMEGFRMDDEGHMARLLVLCRRPEVRLVVMDSLSSLVVGGAASSGRGGEAVKGVPRALRMLGEFGRLTGTPILVVHHLRKRTSGDALRQAQGAVALERLRGTSRIGQTARVVWSLDAPDGDRPEVRRLAVVKNNLMERPEPIGMGIVHGGLVFGAAPESSKEFELVSQMERGMGLLAGLLEDGERRAVDIEAAFVEAGISKWTMKRVKKKMGVRSVKKGNEGWWWVERGGRIINW